MQIGAGSEAEQCTILALSVAKATKVLALNRTDMRVLGSNAAAIFIMMQHPTHARTQLNLQTAP